jgi:hypothetical protein
LGAVDIGGASLQRIDAEPVASGDRYSALDV